jgi:hypothetical protein
MPGKITGHFFYHYRIRFLNHSDADDPVNGFDFLYQIIIDFTIQINDIVRHISFAFVDHVGNVDIAFAQKMRNLFDHAGRVLV